MRCRPGACAADGRTRVDAHSRARLRGQLKAPLVREIMAERSSWTRSAADLLRADNRSADSLYRDSGWPKNPRALAGRLRRAQTFLRALGIGIAFSREGRAGSRIIRIRATQKIPSVP